MALIINVNLTSGCGKICMTTGVAFPHLVVCVILVRLKHELWNRYGFFFDVDVIAEVFPENELASWVAKAYESYSIAKVEFRDEEMVCERTNWSFDDRCPRRMRSFDEELQVLNRRAKWRRFTILVSLER